MTTCLPGPSIHRLMLEYTCGGGTLVLLSQTWMVQLPSKSFGIKNLDLDIGNLGFVLKKIRFYEIVLDLIMY